MRFPWNQQAGDYHGGPALPRMHQLHRFRAHPIAANLALACAVPSALAPVDQAQKEPEKLALLVGIERYAPGTPKNLSKLEGCVRDVEVVRDLLVERFGFGPGDVRILSDEDATHEGIVRSFHDHLIARAEPGTEVLFWYSGHGSRAPDVSRATAAELGGMDSTFLAYDSRAHGEDGAFDLSDDEMRSLLAALAGKTTRITVVTDSCHSGGATRGASGPLEPRIRGADDGGRPVDRERLLASFWPKDVPLLDDSDPSMLLPPTHVHIAACGPGQLAQEIDVEAEDGRLESHGALTFFLAERLRESQPGSSYRRLADDVSVRVSTRCPAQTVWAEGALSRELFGARFEPRPSGFRARAEVLGEGRVDVRIEAGAVHGLRRGSVVSLHRGEELVGRAEIVRAHAVKSLARWIDPVPREVPAGALRALEETRPAREEPLRLHVADPRIVPLVAASQRVRVIDGDPRAAEYEISVEPDGKLVFLGPGGVRIWKASERIVLDEPRACEALAQGLEDEFREELRYRALVGLAGESGSLRVSGRFVAPTDEEIERFKSSRYERCTGANPRVEESGHGSPAGGVFRAYGTPLPDEELSLAMLVVGNEDARPIHVAVLSVSEDRDRNPIWPQEGEQDRVLEPGQNLRVPVNVVSSPDWAAPRPMRDRYLVLATLEAADFTPLAREEVTRGDPPPLRMPSILALALERPQTRGVSQASTDRSAYGLCVVDLYVDPREER